MAQLAAAREAGALPAEALEQLRASAVEVERFGVRLVPASSPVRIEHWRTSCPLYPPTSSARKKPSQAILALVCAT